MCSALDDYPDIFINKNNFYYFEYLNYISFVIIVASGLTTKSELRNGGFLFSNK